MFIDYVTLLLINMVGALIVLAAFVYKGLDEVDQRHWAPAFALPGLIALVNGLNMSWNWPLPGSYNVAYGDLSVLFGTIYLAAGWSLVMNRSLMPVAIYAFFVGLASFVVGERVFTLNMTTSPPFSAAGFFLTGILGICAAPALYLRSNRFVRIAGVLVILAATFVWALNGYGGYWMHLQTFSKWTPH